MQRNELSDLLKHRVVQSRNCQRNWSDKEIDPLDVKYLLDIAYQTPTKQNLLTFDVIAVVNEKFKKQLRKMGDIDQADGDQFGNTQLDSQLILLWLSRDGEDALSNGDSVVDRSKYELPIDLVPNHANDMQWWGQTMMEIGISSGMTTLIAQSMGLQTGYCACFDQDQTVWPQSIINTITRRLNPKPSKLWRPELMVGFGYGMIERPTPENNEPVVPENAKSVPHKGVPHNWVYGYHDDPVTGTGNLYVGAKDRHPRQQQNSRVIFW